MVGLDPGSFGPGVELALRASFGPSDGYDLVAGCLAGLQLSGREPKNLRGGQLVILPHRPQSSLSSATAGSRRVETIPACVKSLAYEVQPGPFLRNDAIGNLRGEDRPIEKNFRVGWRRYLLVKSSYVADGAWRLCRGLGREGLYRLYGLHWWPLSKLRIAASC